MSKKHETLAVYKPGIPTEPASLNVLSCIELLPQGLASALSDAELKGIMELFMSALDYLVSLERFRDHALADGTRLDLTQSAKQLLLGESLWPIFFLGPRPNP